MQCSSEQVQRTLASVMVADKYFLSLHNVLSHLIFFNSYNLIEIIASAAGQGRVPEPLEPSLGYATGLRWLSGLIQETPCQFASILFDDIDDFGQDLRFNIDHQYKNK